MKMKRGILNVVAGLVLTAMLLMTYLDSSASANKVKETFKEKCLCENVECNILHSTFRSQGKKNIEQVPGTVECSDQSTSTRGTGMLCGEAVLMQ